MTKKIHLFIFFFIISLFFYSCGGCGDGRKHSSNDGINNSATLVWDAPTTNIDGSPLNDLAGYRIYYGTSSGNYATAITISADNANCKNINNTIQCTYMIKHLSPGAYYFSVTAYDKDGNESYFSNERTKTIK